MRSAWQQVPEDVFLLQLSWRCVTGGRTREAVTYTGIRRVQRGRDLWHASTVMRSEHKMTQRQNEGAAYCLNSLDFVTGYHGSPT